MNTKVNIAGVELKNPVMTASGTFGSGMEFSDMVDLNKLGAVVTKGVSNVPWPGNPTPRIAEIYGGLWKIEETFKVTKTGMLNLRPVFHSKQDRIRAHFMICFIALVLERLLEKQLGWKYSAKTIQESLSSFSAVQLDNSNIYQVSYYDAVIDEILKTLDIPIQKKFMTQNEIRTLIGQTKKKDYES